MSECYSRVSDSTSISTHPMFGQSINTQTHHINTPHLHGCPVSPVITCTIQSHSHLCWLSLTLLSRFHIPETHSSSFTCVSIHLIPPHTIIPMFSCPFSSTIRSVHHSLPLSSVPSQTRIGEVVKIDCGWFDCAFLPTFFKSNKIPSFPINF